MHSGILNDKERALLTFAVNQFLFDRIKHTREAPCLHKFFCENSIDL